MRSGSRSPLDGPRPRPPPPPDRCRARGRSRAAAPTSWPRTAASPVRVPSPALLMTGVIHLADADGLRLTAGHRLTRRPSLVRDEGLVGITRRRQAPRRPRRFRDRGGWCCLPRRGSLKRRLHRRPPEPWRQACVCRGRGPWPAAAAAGFGRPVVVMDRTNLRTPGGAASPSTSPPSTCRSSRSAWCWAGARLLARHGQVVALVKPQFEAGKGEVPRGGVSGPRNPPAVPVRVAHDAADAGLVARRLGSSPHTGRDGNVSVSWPSMTGRASQVRTHPALRDGDIQVEAVLV